MARSIVVVGGQFEEFAKISSAVTINNFVDQAASGQASGRVVIGQGISHREVQALADNRDAYGPQVTVEARDELAPLSLTHKHDARNVLITHPRRTGKGAYVAHLALNDENDRLLDHVTGAHLSAMVLIEAGRQAAIATGEIEYDLRSRSEPWGFVWTGLRADFNYYAFPVPTLIRLTMTEDEASTPEKPKCTTKVVFEQAAKPMAEMEMSYGLLPKRLLGVIEARAAKQTVRTICGGAADLVSAGAG